MRAFIPLCVVLLCASARASAIQTGNCSVETIVLPDGTTISHCNQGTCTADCELVIGVRPNGDHYYRCPCVLGDQ